MVGIVTSTAERRKETKEFDQSWMTNGTRTFSIRILSQMAPQSVLLITRRLASPMNKKHVHLQVLPHCHYQIHILDSSSGRATIRLEIQDKLPPTVIHFRENSASIPPHSLYLPSARPTFAHENGRLRDKATCAESHRRQMIEAEIQITSR